MERLVLVLAAFAPVSSGGNAITSTNAAQLLNGRGPATVAYTSTGGINLDKLLDIFPTCDNKCIGSTPCGSTSLLASLGSSSCVATTKSKSPSCPNAYVCCDPATCRATTQSRCSYGTSNVVSNLNGLNFKSALQYLAYLGGGAPTTRSPSDTTAIFDILEKPVDVADNSKRCESQCNGWNGVWGCPTSCDCVKSPVPSLVVGEKYRCVGTGFGASGYASPATKFPNGTVLCPSGYACDESVASSTPCISQPIRTATSAPAYLPPPLSSVNQASGGSNQTTAIAVGSTCGALGLVGAGAMYFLYRKKKKQHEDDEHAASVLASHSNDHYHEAPNGA